MADSQRKTANLFIQKLTGVTIASTGEIVSDPNYDTYIAEVSDGETYTVSNVTGTQVFGFFTTEPTAGTITYNSSRTIFSTPSQTLTVPTGENIKYIGVRYNTGVSNAMLNTGSSPLPYEPYGWLHSLRKLGTATDTITTIPADLYADGNNATVGLVGNMSQTGTPTPSSPIQPQECGERTENLTTLTEVTHDGYVKSLTPADSHLFDNIEYDTEYTLSWEITSTSTSSVYNQIRFIRSNSTAVRTLNNGDSFTLTSTEMSEIAAIAFYFGLNNTNGRMYNFMLNTGSTALPYEPYGYKLDIKSGNTTTPVYLGEVETTRKIRKIVFVGSEDENWSSQSAGGGATRFRYTLANSVQADTAHLTSICTHLPLGVEGGTWNTDDIYTISNNYLWLRLDSSFTTVSALKSYLQQQYAAGTPVTIWYVLATPETGIVNEPIRKIGDYADTVSGITIPTITGADSFDVLTTLKPSEVELTYHGWHDATVKEWDGSEWQ